MKYWLELAKKYEVWDPEPKKIEPGIYGSPPSDAIVLLMEMDFKMASLNHKRAC